MASQFPPESLAFTPNDFIQVEEFIQAGNSPPTSPPEESPNEPLEIQMPRKHPLEDPPYAFSRVGGIGHLGGDGPEAASEAWLACSRAVREYDDKLIQAWRMEMDNTLVFAGLFSAVVTAFVLVSYQWLSQDPQDQMVTLLFGIQSQLNNLSGGTISPTSNPVNSDFSPSALNIAINALWFASLVITLHAVLMAILVKQWLNEYTWTIGSKVSSPHQTASLRQFRFEGLTTWRIPQIINYLPSQLVVAVFLFFAGLLCMLWGLNSTVAAPTTAVVGLSTMYFVATTVLPAIIPTCGYKSAQAWLVHRVIRGFGTLYKRTFSRRFSTRERGEGNKNKSNAYANPRGWTDDALRYLENTQARIICDAGLLSWIYSSLTSWDRGLVPNVWNCAMDLPIQAAHRVIRQMAGLTTLDRSSKALDVNQGQRYDLEKHAIETQTDVTFRHAANFGSSLRRLVDKMGHEAYSGDEPTLELYNAYLNGLKITTSDGSPENHLSDSVWDSASDVELIECITALRFFHFDNLPKPNRVNQMSVSGAKISEGNVILVSLLDEGDVSGARVEHSKMMKPLQKVILEDIRRLARKNWDFVDYEAKAQLEYTAQVGGSGETLVDTDSAAYALPALRELDAFVSAALSQVNRTDTDTEIVVSLVESTLLMSRRVNKTDFGMKIANQIALLIKAMSEFSQSPRCTSSVQLEIVDKWVPLLERGAEMSVIEEWDLDKGGLGDELREFAKRVDGLFINELPGQSRLDGVDSGRQEKLRAFRRSLGLHEGSLKSSSQVTE